jgi:hypothetical protein
VLWCRHFRRLSHTLECWQSRQHSKQIFVFLDSLTLLSMMQLSLMMLTAIGHTVQADQACHDGMCPPKVNSLLQIGGHSTDVLQVDPTTATTTFLLADSISVNKQCTSKGLLGLYNFGKKRRHQQQQRP